MSADLQLQLVSRLDTLADLNEGIEKFASENQLGKSVVFDLRLVLEELIVNIISYAFEDSEAGHPIGVFLEITKYGEAVQVTIEDNGRSFNPVENLSPDDSPTAEPGVIGGFGIFLVDQKTQDLTYQRVNGEKNRVTFWMDAGGG